jgi:peptidoglycan hydrolase-like protein with peptidoglycan-binding domain
MAQGEISNYFLDGAAGEATRYRTKNVNIPFASSGRPSGPRINVKLVYDKFDRAGGDAEFRSALPGIKNRAANRFLLHYFPEYYALYRVIIRNKNASQGYSISDHETGFQRLRQSLKESATAQYYTSATKPATESVAVVSVNEFRFALTGAEVDILKISTGQSSPIYGKVRNLEIPASNELAYFNTPSPTEMKTLLTLLGMIPTGTGVDTAFQLFNNDENITAGSKTTTLQVGSFLSDNKAANDGLSAYQQQLDGFEGSLPINLNFTDMQKGIFTILNGVVMQNLMQDLTDVHSGATLGGPYLDFSAADSLEITFGKRREHGDVPPKTCIASIKYFVAQASLSQQHMRVGYMTNILYNKAFSDQLVLSTLKNYEFLVRSMKASELFGGPNISFTEFLDENAGDFGLEGNTVWEDIPNPAAAVDDMKLKEAVRLGIIDLEDVKSLEKGFEASLTPEQLKRYKEEVIENPEFQKKLKIAKRKMAFSTAKDINKVIIGFLEGSPEGLGIRNNSPLGQLLRKIGIQELAMEAMICATFGLAPSFARIGRAAQSALQQTQAGPVPGGIGAPATSLAAKAAKIRLAQLGRPPKAPKPSVVVPKQDKKMFEPPTLDKELWESLRKNMLDGLMKGVMEVIKSLAALLKELCEIANPYAQDEGTTDVGDLVRNNLDQNFQDAPAISNESALDQMFANDGLTSDQVLGDGTINNKGYLTALSAILTSMEICFLFTDRSQVSDFTLEKIVDFNLTYPDPQIQQNLNTPTAVLSFFANLSRFVDITDLCNKIATDLYNANIDNICLVEEKAPDLIDKILEDLAENGMELDSPFPYNLQCPLRADYINNDLVNSTIPSFLGAVQEAVEIEFVNGLSAAMQILKEPVISQSESTAHIAGTLQAAGLIGGTGQGPDQFSEFGPDLDAAAAAKSEDIMKKVSDIFKDIGDKIDDLDNYCDVGALLGAEGSDIAGITDTIIKVLNNFVQHPEFINGIRDIDRRLAELTAAANSTAGLSSISTQYQFPTSFRSDFAAYIDKQSSLVDASYGTIAPQWNREDPDIPLSRVHDVAAQTESSATSIFGNFKARASSSSTNPDRKYVYLTYTFPTNAVPYFQEAGFESFTLGGQQVPRFVTRYPGYNDYDTWKIMFVQGPAWLQLNSDLLGGDVDQRFEPLSRDYQVATWEDVNSSMSPFASVLFSRLRRQVYAGGATMLLNYQLAKNPDVAATAASFHATKTTISSVLFPALYAGQTEAMFDFILKNGIFDTPRLDSLNFFFDNRGCIPDNVADLLDMGPGSNACGPSILDEVNEELLQALCHDGADPDDLNPQGTQIRDVVRHFTFLVLLQIHIAQFIVKNIFVFSAFEIDDLLTMGTIKDFMAINIRNQVQKLIETKPIVGENLVKYYNKKIQRAPVVNQGGLLDADGNVVFPPDKRFRQSDVPAIIEYMTKDRITKSRCAVANAVKRSSGLTNPKDFDRAFVEDVLTVMPSYFGARALGTQYKPVSPGPSMIQIRQRGDTGDPENGFYPGVNMNTSEGIQTMTALLNKIPSYFGGSEGVKLTSGADASWRGFARKMKYGKIVLERQVVYDSVSANAPDPLSKTTGSDYGIEKDLFEQMLFNPDVAEFVPTDSTYTFTNLRFKYNIVYYFPAVASTMRGDQPESLADIFGGTEPFYNDLGVGKTRVDHRLAGWENISRYVLTSLDTELDLKASIDNQEESQTTILETQSDGSSRIVTAMRPVLQTLLSSYGTTVTDSELELIVSDPVFKDYFDRSINRSVTSLIPILENFYLTSNFFPKMDNILQGAKDRCLGIYVDSILNQTPQPPAPTVSPQALAAASLDPLDPLAGLTTSARDFILKMLIETPINILRGVAETMDPHVGITKIIREITAHVFNGMAKGMDVSPPVKFLRDGPTPQAGQAPPAAGQDGFAYADNAPAGTQMYTYDDDPELEYARVPGGEWMVRKRGFTTKWTPLPPGGGATGINTADLEVNAVPLNAADYYDLLPEQLRGLVEYKIPGDVVNDYATFTNIAGDETFWLTRKRAANKSWEEATRVTSGALITRLEANKVARYSTAQHGTTLNQADLDAHAAELQASLAELPTSSLLSFTAPGPDVVNEDVRILQAKLEELAANQPSGGTFVYPQGVDGRFGIATKASVEALQTYASINIDGIVGSDTWAALEQALTEQAQARLAAEAGTGGGILPNIKGEDIMKLLFCLLEMGMAEAAIGFNLGECASQSPPAPNSPDWENFVGNPGGGPGIGPGSNSLAAFIGNPVVPGSDPLFPLLTYVEGDNDPRDPRNTIPDDLRGAIFPKFSMDGVDFTGTLLGLLMLPPGPFGIVYLLLMLLGKELEDALTPDEDGSATDGSINVSEEQSGERC